MIPGLIPILILIMREINLILRFDSSQDLFDLSQNQFDAGRNQFESGQTQFDFEHNQFDSTPINLSFPVIFKVFLRIPYAFDYCLTMASPMYFLLPSYGYPMGSLR